MTVQTLKLGGRDYVIVPKKDFNRIQAQAEAKRRLADVKDKSLPWEQVRKELGL